MKIATLMFASQDARQRYFKALRERMYAAGYEPHQVTDWIRLWSPGGTSLRAAVSGTDDAERAKDVANEVRGVVCKLRDA